MRAICAFLLPRPEGDLLAAADVALRERYANTYCGLDNWWRPLECVLVDGTTTATDPLVSLALRYPLAERWEKLHRWMVDETIADFIYFTRGTAPSPTLRARIEAAFPDDGSGTAREHANRALERMDELLREIDQVARTDVEMVQRTLESLHRVYNLLFEASMLSTVPFSATFESPYIYRAFDLRDEHEEPCMYVVEMHL